ncbi:MAG: phosphodiesterase YaeI [Acidobacteria bacterium]|nr:phosphodiesterase YaeI [Acidobacteriota bacterium]
MPGSITRRSLFVSLPLGLFGTAAYARYVEPTWLKFSTIECRLPGLRLGRTLRLIHLSDLHASSLVPAEHIEKAIRLSLAARPDLISITGDFGTVGDSFDPDWYRAQLRLLSQAAPTYACFGNHDGGQWSAGRYGYITTVPLERLLGSGGVGVLKNGVARVRAAGSELQLVGVGDLWAGQCDPAMAFREADAALPTILLSHNPDSKDSLGGYPWGLMLCGHTHGGQVVLPLAGIDVAPVRDKRYVAGLNFWGRRPIHTSSGVGNAWGVRFNCRPEVTLIEIR